jgi:starch phosphorylase
MFTCSIYHLREKLISVEILEKILPRHLELIYLINFDLIERLKVDHPDQVDRFKRMSLIEEAHPKSVRMDKLILHACEKI